MTRVTPEASSLDTRLSRYRRYATSNSGKGRPTFGAQKKTLVKLFKHALPKGLANFKLVRDFLGWV